MKKILKIFGLISLICFSFFYTDRVMNVVSDQDPLKIKILELSDNYKILPNQAVVTDNTIIPGTNGKEVDIEKSYKKMLKINVFDENKLVYKQIYPEYRLIDNLDKYVIGGNINIPSVSLLFIVNQNNNLDEIIDILNKKNISANLFIEYKYLFNNISKIKQYSNHNIYSYNEEYTYDTLIVSNNIIKRISDNLPMYCLVKKENNNNLNVCSYAKMNTIIPSVIGSYSNIKNKLDNGDIILFDTSINTLNELEYIIDFILSKGKKIVTLDKLLDENI